MARHTRLDVLNTIVGTGLVPIFYHSDAAVARRVIGATAVVGCPLFEFTNRGDFALDVFKELALYCREALPDVILGAGSVVDAPTAALYAAYGAEFIVGPVFNKTVARFCNRRKLAYMPGCGTVSEISAAEELGVEIVKVFPADSIGGPEFVKSVLGPCPWTRIMPTGGVAPTQAGLAAWFKAGVVAVGIGSKLMRKDLIAAGNYAAMSAQTVEILGWIRQVRG